MIKKNKIILLLLLLCLFLTSLGKEEATLIIKNGAVLTMNKNGEKILNGVVVIKDNKIINVGSKELLTQYTAKKIIDAKKGIIMPGMINTHSHLPMIAFRGLGKEGIENRLYDYLFPLEKEKLSRDLIYKSTIHGSINMAGFRYNKKERSFSCS